MANVAHFERLSLALRYQYYDREIDKEVKKGFALPDVKNTLTQDQLFELVHTIAALIDIPEESIISGELNERTQLYIK